MHMVLKLKNQDHFPLESFSDRRSIDELNRRTLDGFGAYRIRGHKHAGLDIEGGYGEIVYPLGAGRVVGTLYEFPYLAVVIEHTLDNGSVIYSSYVHIGEVLIEPGTMVGFSTPIAKLFTEEQFLRSGFSTNHLHLEIRKTLEDEGVASYTCKTIEELNRYFYDPLNFLTEKLTE